MNYIVLLKQVPDIKNIPTDAWDWEKGTLRRGLLDNVVNELDKQALAFALKMREQHPGRIVSLTMGPPFASEIMRYALSVGADIGVLLTDRKLSGADTAATAYPLGQAIRKIEKEIFGSDTDYIVVSGMQSIDGDTAQVPPQVAEELGIAHIAYATSFSFAGTELKVKRITRKGAEIVSPRNYPCLITVTKWIDPPNASFARTRWAYSQKLYQWSAEDVNADDDHIGLIGSRTTVYRIFSMKEAGNQTCVFLSDMGKLVKLLGKSYTRRSRMAKEADKGPSYHLLEGKATSYKGDVWVYVEQEGGVINPASLELLGKATELASLLGEKVGAVLVGKDIKSLAAELIGRGADKVYVAEDRLLEHFLPVPYTKAVSQLIERYGPQVMLFGATPLGRELSPRIAYRLKSGLTADCTRLDIMDFEKGKWELTAVLGQTRPALGGNIMASIITQNSVVQMSTVRPGVMRALELDTKRTGEIIEHMPGLQESDLGARIISTELYELTSDITEAVAIACGGAGCRTKDNFNKLIIPLAESLGKFLGEKAIVAASRAAVELGFIEYSHQVGQTGQTVKPRVYIAVGVSGAVQHLTGMQNSDIIIAINNDPGAPIFKVADYGVVGNMDVLVPQLINALNLQGQSGEQS